MLYFTSSKITPQKLPINLFHLKTLAAFHMKLILNVSKKLKFNIFKTLYFFKKIKPKNVTRQPRYAIP